MLRTVPTPPLRICGSCGAQVPRRKNACEVCQASALSVREVPTNDSVGVFVRATASFRCRSCGQRSAFEGFDVDGTVDCDHCGMTQAYDLGVWSEAFRFVHGLTDLGRSPATDPDTLAGMQNPFAEAGETRAVYTFTTSGLTTVDGVQRTASLDLSVALAHPLCPRCQGVLELRDASGLLETACTACGDRASYRVPESPYRIQPLPTAVVEGSARSDAAPVKVEGDAGALAIRCPSCSASLAATGTDSLIACTYCRTLCRIPARTLHALRPKGAAPAPFFVAFRGSSLLRRKLQDEARAAQSAREGSQKIEAFPMIPSTPRVLAMRAVVTLVLLILVGLAYSPKLLAILDGTPRP